VGQSQEDLGAHEGIVPGRLATPYQAPDQTDDPEAGDEVGDDRKRQQYRNLAKLGEILKEVGEEV